MNILVSQRRYVGGLANWLLAVCFLLFSSVIIAHEIPERVQLKFLVHEDGDSLKLLIRVPLEAMRDVDFSIRGPGYLNFSESLPLINDAVNLWVLDELVFFQGDSRLSQKGKERVRISLPSNKDFDAYKDALAYFESSLLPDDTDLFWRQANIDISLSYPLINDSALFSIQSALSGLGQRTLSTVIFTDRQRRNYQYDFSGDSGLLALNPGRFQVAKRFVLQGFLHIAKGFDHLLFIFVLLAPIRKIRLLIKVMTAVILAQSISLSAAALGFSPNVLWFSPLVELLIALSIMIFALANIFEGKYQGRWLTAFFFALIHGFSFSGFFSETLQYSGNHLATALLGFNVGVALAQIAFLLCLLLLLSILNAFSQTKFQTKVLGRSEKKMAYIILSLFITHTSLHYLQERWQVLSAYL